MVKEYLLNRIRMLWILSDFQKFKGKKARKFIKKMFRKLPQATAFVMQIYYADGDMETFIGCTDKETFKMLTNLHSDEEKVYIT